MQMRIGANSGDFAPYHWRQQRGLRPLLLYTAAGTSHPTAVYGAKSSHRIAQHRAVRANGI